MSIQNLIRDYEGKSVLITGGTKGIGLKCALSFAERGAQVFLTHRWGSADENEIREKFNEIGAPAPVILEADASRKADTKALMESIAETSPEGIDVFISNVCVVMRGDGVENHQERALIKSLEYSSWPFVEYLHALKNKFERYPKYAVAMSSDGPDRHYPAYDYVAVAKSVLETFVRYMSTHLQDEGVCINALRTRQVLTDSYRQIFGEEQVAVADEFSEFAMTVQEVADTTLALCSGLMDSISGQVIMLDGGSSFVDNVMTMGPRLMRAARGESVEDKPVKVEKHETTLNDFTGKAVLITGGTKGIGLSTGLAFAKAGAQVYLTHRWGSADEGALRKQFSDIGALEPIILEADVSQDEDTEALLNEIKKKHDSIEALISNVSFAHVSKDHTDLSKKALGRSLKYSAWPFVGYLQKIKEVFGKYPRYSVGMSSRGPEYFLPGYDFVAASKAVMETFCQYLTSDLIAEDIRINVIRANPVETESLEATFGPEFGPFCRKYYGEGFFIAPEEVADATLAVCSGLMDGLKGQILLLDRGFGFADNVVRLFTHRQRYGL